MAQPRTRSDPTQAQGQNGNHILAALPQAEYERLQQHLIPVELEQRQLLWDPNQPITAVHFPIDAVASILAVTEDGGVVEVATIGNEGLIGLPVFLGAVSSPGRAIVQVAGRAFRLDQAVFRREAQRPEGLRPYLERYTQGFLTEVSQSTACNRMHTPEQRFARWLLIVRDRVHRDEFPLTHEFLGQMLAVRRATVTEVAGRLQSQGLISYSRGVINIRDRKGLERAACECYRIVRDEFKRLLGIRVG